MIDSKSYVIGKDDDIEQYKGDFMKNERISLDLKDSKLDKNKFIDMFNKLRETKKTDFKLDLSSIEMDEDRVNAFTNCLTSWNDLRNLQLNFRNLHFSEQQFNKICDAIQNMKNLERLNIDLQNVNIDHKMRDRLEKLFTNLPKMKDISISTRSSHLSQQDVERLNNVIRSIPRFVHWHDFPMLYPAHFCPCYHHDWPMLL